jgi:RNA recognition motif-containing protein
VTIVARNLSRDVTEDDLRKLFRTYGEVAFVNIIKERDHKTSAGFGFIAMPVEQEAEAAIADLHMKVVKGQAMNVIEARPKPLS